MRSVETSSMTRELAGIFRDMRAAFERPSVNAPLGSRRTSAPRRVDGLASKDVIDIQVSVEQDSDLDGVARELEKAGWTPRSDINQDHDVPGMPVDERARQKWFLREPPAPGA